MRNKEEYSMKQVYETPELVRVMLDTTDIITTSGVEDETERFWEDE